MSEKLSILFYRSMKRKGQDGLVPLYIRVTIDGDYDEMSTSKRIEPKLWDQNGEYLKTEH